jgi:uncharacterized protein (UPF0333 family)
VIGLKAQSSLEFLVFASISILFLVAAVTFFGVRAEEVDEMSAISEMKSICQSVSSKISAVFSAGSGTSTTIRLPAYVSGENISVWVYGNNANVIVADGERSVGCALNIKSVSNGTSISFQVAQNATITNSEGVVLIG